MQYCFYPGCSYFCSGGYTESINTLNRALGIKFVELTDWNCCGATAISSLNQMDSITLIGRNIALANRQQFDEIITVCNACYTSLRKGIKALKDDPKKVSEINQRLNAEGLKIERIIPVRHYVEVLYHDIPEHVWTSKKSIVFPNIKVATYYGCQFSRPWADVDDPVHPQIMDRFLRRIGFDVVDHSAKTLCCGASHGVQFKNECQKLVDRIVSEARRKGAQCLAAMCPLCQFNVDTMQIKASSKLMPIPYFTQLAGLALGFSEKELGMNKLFISISSGIHERLN